MQTKGTKGTASYWNIFEFTTLISFHTTLMAFLRMKVELKAVNAEGIDRDARVVYKPMKKKVNKSDQSSSLQ